VLDKPSVMRNAIKQGPSVDLKFVKNRHLDQALLARVKDMGQHMRGEQVAGALVREYPEPDVKASR
jgi:hypothetical protein